MDILEELLTLFMGNKHQVFVEEVYNSESCRKIIETERLNVDPNNQLTLDQYMTENFKKENDLILTLLA